MPTKLPASDAPDTSSEMGFIDHLEALRWHIIRSVIVILVIAVIIFINIDWVFDYIIYGPLRNDFVTYHSLCKLGHQLHMGDALCMPAPNVKMQVTQFGSQFISSITISFIGGFIVAFPYIFWEFWRFIKPALTPRELSKTRGSIFWVSLFFLIGISFGYFMLAPFTFSFLSNFTLGTLQAIETKPTLDDYMDNMINILLGTGLAFELPVISFVLTRIGLITPQFLQTYRKYAYVVILVAAAIITPSPDWMSQMLVAVPLALLYELSILVSHKVIRDQLREEAAYYQK